MKKKIKQLILNALIAGVCSMSVLSFAQTKDKNVLLGKWIVENVVAFEENVQVPFTLDSLGCEIPTEMDIQQDEIILVLDGQTMKVPYHEVVRGNGMCILVCGEWKVVGNKLELTWEVDIMGKEPERRKIVLTYKLK